MTPCLCLFEMPVVPMGGAQSEERPPAPNGYPFSGPIQSQLPSQQSGVRYPPYNRNVYGQQPAIYQGQAQPYYPNSNSYPQQQPYQPYNPYPQHNPNNGYYNQQAQNPYYNQQPQQPQRVGFPPYRPQFQQVGK